MRMRGLLCCTKVFVVSVTALQRRLCASVVQPCGRQCLCFCPRSFWPVTQALRMGFFVAASASKLYSTPSSRARAHLPLQLCASVHLILFWFQHAAALVLELVIIPSIDQCVVPKFGLLSVFQELVQVF